jgi:2-polyprenyl-3-methyl-5-hydroxy-6-metoxy-1,4-benzoquinol methylase
MQYDPVKTFLGKIFNSHPSSRILFYKMLDLVLLRSWHIHRELRRWHREEPGERTILDAGAGFGQYTYFLSSLSTSYHIRAVDISEEHTTDCSNFFHLIHRDHQVTCEHLDLTCLSEPETYGLILCIDVMEHIREDEIVFRNFFLSLQQGGMLLISTPSDKGGSDSHNPSDPSFISEHVRNGYGMSEIESKLKSAGFASVESRYTYGPAGNLSWKISMKIPILAMNISKAFVVLLPIYYLLTYPICLILNTLDLFFQQKAGTGLMVKAWK